MDGQRNGQAHSGAGHQPGPQPAATLRCPPQARREQRGLQGYQNVAKGSHQAGGRRRKGWPTVPQSPLPSPLPTHGSEPAVHPLAAVHAVSSDLLQGRPGSPAATGFACRHSLRRRSTNQAALTTSRLVEGSGTPVMVSVQLSNTVVLPSDMSATNRVHSPLAGIPANEAR